MEEQVQSIEFKAFLETTPLYVAQYVHCSPRNEIERQPIELYCDNPLCEKTMIFDHFPAHIDVLNTEDVSESIVTYQCRHCKTKQQRFAVVFGATVRDSEGQWCINITKFGEFPPIGPPLPKGLLNLAKGDRRLWLTGRKCENQGLGIAAYAYYRRVIERQKNQLFDRMISVCETVEPTSGLIAELERAKSETQFTKALESIRGGVPQALLIKGENPLRLLHDALSEGLHNGSDEDCLQLAKAVRTLMSKTAELMDAVLAENQDIVEAVKRLSDKRRERSSPPTQSGRNFPSTPPETS